MKLFCAFLLAVITTATSINDLSGEADLDPEDDPGRMALDNFPIIDGHNDLAWNLRKRLQNNLTSFDFSTNLTLNSKWGKAACNSCFTDLPRLRAGKVGGQFWVAYGSCESQFKDAVQIALEQIDVIKNLIRKYHNDLEFVDSSSGIHRAIRRNKIASLIGLEGGHLIDSRLAILRMFYDLGVRYLTLAHTCNTPWSDASPIDETSNETSPKGLTNFGKKVILEMNRLGMMVDLSHVSYGVMLAALNISKAPVIFSHSSAYSVFPHHRNVKDAILEKLKNNGGVVMVNFYTHFVGNGSVDIESVVEHINYIVDVAGVNHVGVGGDYDGVDSMPKGLEDVSKYPDLFDALKKSNPQKWTMRNLEKLAGRNIVRVLKKVEEVRDSLRYESPDYSWIPKNDFENITNATLVCRTE